MRQPMEVLNINQSIIISVFQYIVIINIKVTRISDCPLLLFQQTYSLLPIINFSMKLPLLLFLCLLTLSSADDRCGCLNGGACSQQSHCICPVGFIGQKCQYSAHLFSQQPTDASLNTNFTYFYFQPTEMNYYKLTFNICMIHNPSLLPSIFYIETEKANGSLRSEKPLFEAAKLVLGAKGCASFATHYISIKRREDQTYSKIVVGMKALVKDDPSHYLNVYTTQQQSNQNSEKQSQMQSNSVPPQIVQQMITVEVKYDKYMQGTAYGDFILISTASLLLIIFAAFINYLRKRYRFELQDTLNQFQESHLEYLHYRTHSNPETDQREKRRRKNQLERLQIFMPVTKFGQKSCFFVAEALQTQSQQLELQEDTPCCSICLNNFQKDEEVRTTPCKHQYHRDCIDNWCTSHLSCPICRHPLDFETEVRRIYLHFLGKH